MSFLEKIHLSIQLITISLIFSLLVYILSNQLIGFNAILIIMLGLLLNSTPFILINNYFGTTLHHKSPNRTHLKMILPWWLMIFAGTGIYALSIFEESLQLDGMLFAVVPITQAVIMTIVVVVRMLKKTKNYHQQSAEQE